MYRPYGLNGGEDAQCGLNIWVRNVEVKSSEEADRELAGGEGREKKWVERRINLGGKNSAAMKAGERIIVCTPGGGGWGRPEDRKGKPKGELDAKHAWRGGSHASREEAALQA